MEKLSNEKLLQHKIIKKVNETQNLSNIEQPLQAPCLPSGPQSSGILSSDIPELLILQGSSLNVCFNFACLFELKNVSFCSLCLRKWQMLLSSKYPPIFAQPASSIGLRNTGTILTAKHQNPLISLTFLKDEKKSCFVCKMLLIIMTVTFFMTNITSRGR